MQVRYVDAHCHIQFEQYTEDDVEIIERMRTEGIAGIVVGVDLESSKKAVALAERHEHLFASVGLHPNRIADEQYDLLAYRTLAKSPKTVAIGECGLDYFRPLDVNEKVKRGQKEIFNEQIELAAELHKPLIIHSRPSIGTQDAYQDLIQIVTQAKVKHPHLKGDIHFFVGGVEEAQAFIELDFTLSFTAVITFARDYDPVIRAIPLTSILSETDAPYVAPKTRRGQRNDPLAIQEVALKIAEIRGEDPQLVRAVLAANADKLFGLRAL